MNAPKKAPPAAPDTAAPGHFIRQVIEQDLQAGTYASRRWGGAPGDGASHQAGWPDPARIRTRFPPEPNGYLHIGHAKSIWLNFSLARDYGGVCHLRFDDTNPEKEEQEYVDSIRESVRWLGWDHHFADDPAHPGIGQPHEYFASDYFDFMYRAAQYLIEAGHAYVDEQTPEQMRAARGDFATPGAASPFRARAPAENLRRFREMAAGRHPDGAMVLRARIDMASPNMNLRDPAIYRIRRASHHNTGDTWCIYPMYTYAHPIEDALEQITHSICTLEFEDQRPFYDWLLARLIEGGLLTAPPPRQYEFGRMNVGHVITSKRKLRLLVEQGHVQGWDDPRRPTLAGLRRRGYTPASLRLFCERSGVTKSGDAWTDYAALDAALRETLDPAAPRAMAVLEPLKLVIENWAEVFGSNAHLQPCAAPAHPHRPGLGERRFLLGPEIWIERSDYADTPPKGFFRLFPGNLVRLKYGYVIECLSATKDEAGRPSAVRARLLPDTQSGTPGADRVKTKGVITWVSAADGLPAQVRLYERLFTQEQPDAGGKDFLAALNPHSLQTVPAIVEPSLSSAQPEDRCQFERHGFFVADRHDHRPGGPLVFNRITGLKDSWAK
ncbi:MAG: glutamine--tRNA ligase/YqeY domain fusion protein [Burkholderiaceae bacterium]|jgi:glutaminyl-tRNA synthetase|nr:glutamine--tRNA ligase/YqeY domain fusion protein [Burkholderiaceae bacterium]